MPAHVTTLPDRLLSAVQIVAEPMVAGGCMVEMHKECAVNMGLKDSNPWTIRLTSTAY